MRIVVSAGHVGIENIRTDGLCPGRDAAQLRRSTGTTGERAWTGDVAQRLASALRAAGHQASASDASGGDDIRDGADLILSLHLQRDRDSARAFASAPNPAGAYIGQAAQDASQRWVDLFAGIYERRTGIPVTQGSVTANMTDLYQWCYVAPTSACVIVECGHADLDRTTLYNDDALAKVVACFVEITQLWSGGGVAVPPPPPPIILPPAGISVIGPTLVSEAQLVRYLWSGNPRASIAVPALYAKLAPLAGVRAEVAFAQAMHETGFLTFPRIAQPSMHNFAGLGCSETTRLCNLFASDEEGVRGHLGHLLYYFGMHTPAFCDLDQRHFGAHKGYANDVVQLSGHWAPSLTYGDAIAAKVRAVFAA